MYTRHNRVNVIVKGIEIFSTNGYRATGIEEICTHTGLTKGAFYHLFRSKHKFFEECLEVYSLGNINFIEDQLNTLENVGALKKLLHFVRSVFEIQSRRRFAGCLVFNSISELGANDSDSVSLLNNYYLEFIATIEPIIKECQIEGSITTDIASNEAAEMINTYINGMITRMKGGKEDGGLRGYEMVEGLIYRLSPNTN